MDKQQLKAKIASVKKADLEPEQKYAVIAMEQRWYTKLVIPAELLPEFNKVMAKAEILDSEQDRHIKPLTQDQSPTVEYLARNEYEALKMAKLLGVRAEDILKAQQPYKDTGPF